MDMVVKSRHMDVRPDVRSYAEDKIGKVARILNGMAMSVEIELYHERNRSIEDDQVAEVTVFTKGHILRARESASDMKAAIDKVAGKLERQARRFKEKVVDRHVGKGAPAAVAAPEAESPEPERFVVKKKEVSLKPMSEEEAILQTGAAGPRLLPVRIRRDGLDQRALPAARR